ncbi:MULTISPECIES: hypothetical protein [Aeromonas]|nr:MULTISPECIES: hypothetical protein [Aeromonas]MCF5840806.1 hypothetical protein [Aeromonas veronii]MCF5888435.1 hypothetical protein [Aeromonas veronii]WAG06626.1 hypothetical protein NRZ30_16390 [Aeromonas jandaei]
MKKIIFILTTLLWSSFSMSQNFTANGLVSFIYENVTIDAPKGWAEVKATFTITHEAGLTNSKSSYRATMNNSGEEFKFEPTNIFGPHNAARELLKLEAQRDHQYETVIIKMKPNGTATYEFK